MNNSSKIDFIKIKNVLNIDLIITILFNTLFRQKDIKIFVGFIKNLNIKLKKQESKKTINLN